MAICMKCGAVFHDDDIAKHICDAANLPAKGKEKNPQTTEKNV